jgi:hypothetical protein
MISPLYICESLYLLEHKIQLRSDISISIFRQKLFQEVFKICQGKVPIELAAFDSYTFFFKFEPINEIQAIELFVGVVYFNKYQNILEHFCAKPKNGTLILNQYIIPKIPEDDYVTEIEIKPVPTAISFYFQYGFTFKNAKLQSTLKKYSISQIRAVFESPQVFEDVKDAELCKLLSDAEYEISKTWLGIVEDKKMYWSRTFYGDSIEILPRKSLKYWEKYGLRFGNIELNEKFQALRDRYSDTSYMDIWLNYSDPVIPFSGETLLHREVKQLLFANRTITMYYRQGESPSKSFKPCIECDAPAKFQLEGVKEIYFCSKRCYGRSNY